MRILYYMTDAIGYGGVERMIVNWIKILVTKGCDIDIVTTKIENNNYATKLKSLGCNIYIVPYDIGAFLTKNDKLRDILHKKKYEVIHVHGALGPDFLIYKCAKECGIKIRIAHSHNSISEFNHWYAKTCNYLTKWMVKKYANILLGCSYDACISYYGKGASFRVINNGIDTNIFKFDEMNRKLIRKKLLVRKKEVLFGSIGQCNAQKNQKFLLQVYKAVLDRYSAAKFLLIGKGPLEKDIELTIKKLNLQDKLIWIRETSNVSAYLAAMDIFVFPSCYEGLGLVGVEAQSMGLPLLISKQGYHKEIEVTNLVTVLDLKDGANKWSKKCVELVDCIPNEREKYSNVVADNGFSIYSSAEKLYEIYNDALINTLND